MLQIKRLTSPDKTEQAGADLAKKISAPAIIFLEGQLGAGKTTFVRGFLRGLGVTDIIKSPTFTLIETYDVGDMHILHADLYRLKSADELEALGFRDYFTEKNIVLIEWASHAKNVLPKPTIRCALQIPKEGDGRILEMSES